MIRMFGFRNDKVAVHCAGNPHTRRLGRATIGRVL